MTQSAATTIVPRRFQDGAELLRSALLHVTVQSVRDWADMGDNRSTLEKIAQGILDKNRGTYDELRFATWLVCESIGL